MQKKCYIVLRLCQGNGDPEADVSVLGVFLTKGAARDWYKWHRACHKSYQGDKSYFRRVGKDWAAVYSRKNRNFVDKLWIEEADCPERSKDL